MTNTRIVLPVSIKKIGKFIDRHCSDHYSDTSRLPLSRKKQEYLTATDYGRCFVEIVFPQEPSPGINRATGVFKINSIFAPSKINGIS